MGKKFLYKGVDISILTRSELQKVLERAMLEMEDMRKRHAEELKLQKDLAEFTGFMRGGYSGNPFWSKP